MTYLHVHGQDLLTPQTEAIAGKDMVRNEAGGFGFKTDIWECLSRFLILGSEGGTYYTSQGDITKQCTDNIRACIALDSVRVVEIIRDISVNNRAYKVSPSLFALALCFTSGNRDAKLKIEVFFNEIVRTGSHLLEFVSYLRIFGGWGRSKRRLAGGWYEGIEDKTRLAFQCLKYQNRCGYSHRDVFRLAHPRGGESSVYHWIARGWESIGEEPPVRVELRQIWAYEKLKRSEGEEVARLVREYDLPLECIPPDKRTVEVWRAVLPNLGIIALLRNLGNLSKAGILTREKGNPFTAEVINRIHAPGSYKPLHPLQILIALNTYKAGKGVRGSGTWEPVGAVVDALDEAFYGSFSGLKETMKRIVVGLDMSSSMTTSIQNVPSFSAACGAGALMMLLRHIMPFMDLVAFNSTWLKSFGIDSWNRLDYVQKVVRKNLGGNTDCSIPIQIALEDAVPCDAIIILTDNQTWQGDGHPVEWMEKYWQRFPGTKTKFISVAMTATDTSIAEDYHPLMMNVVGFDASMLDIIQNFIDE